ncbi:tyrosine-type recombinase/integrase [Radiobacillus deserti]|uniref:Tyrosine-type recombinase/integrase n=1 Tax=Radiobacillus deserti TaxID=2594883 RepID=A0A516KDJ9_9BACI|nr:tyrosine-type recombinase/integrase [Radiobacillus deserti]QDP39450.1 tyrosine-type recombinase/integrase [Radiobacillus deserti]
MSQEELRLISDDKAEINYSLDDLIEVFIEDCEFRNLREYTIKYYRSELKQFKKLLLEQGLSNEPKDITGDVIKHNVVMYMRNKGIKTVSVNSRLRAIRAFFNLLESQNYLKLNPMKDIKLLKDRKRIVETFDKKQIKALFKACDLRTFVGLRDYTIMMFLLETGVRANELIGIKVTDIVWSQKVVRITNTKGGYERFVPIQNKMIDQLNKYVTIRGQIDTNYLFITQDDTPLSKKQMQDRIREYGGIAKLKNVRCSPHTFRHTFAKMSVMNGANAFQLQAILGHSTLEVTKMYVN